MRANVRASATASSSAATAASAAVATGGKEGWMNEMQNMEKVIAIYELLGGKNEQQIQDLVTLYRKWVRTDDFLLREAPFSASSKSPHVCFLFKDLLLIGKPSKPNLPEGNRKSVVMSMFTGGGGGNATNRARTRSGSGEASLTPLPPTQQDSGTMKLVHHLPLVECTFKALPAPSSQQDTSSGVQLTRVCRVKQLSGDGKTLHTVTKVEKMELWFASTEQRDLVLDEFLYCEEEDDEDDEEDSESLGDDEEVIVQLYSSPPSGKRSWAKNLPKRTVRANSDESSLSNANNPDATPLSLGDLEQRYNVDFSQTAEMKNVEEFTVEFGEGQMGFSLSSGVEVGVVVGKLSPQGFAQLGGCEIGDRLDTVNGIQVDMDTSWQRAVEMIKACGRPVTLKFVRNVALLAQVQQAVLPPTTHLDNNIHGKGTRKWATRKQRGTSDVAGLSALQELEKIYGTKDSLPLSSTTLGLDEDCNSIVEDDNASTATPASSLLRLIGPGQEALNVLQEFNARCQNEDERACVSVLTEIYLTEREFVASLRGLITEYVVPLRRSTKRKRCRDLDTSALMCEHASLKSKCSKISSTSGPMLSPEDIRTVFMNLETIVKVNAELLNSIESGLLTAGGDGGLATNLVSDGLSILVEIFSTNFDAIKPFFSMYALYCHQYPMAVARLQKMRNEDEEVDACIRDREAKSKQTSLRSLLIKPVQRICRYPLLFQELLKRAKAIEQTREELLRHIQQTAEDADKIAQDVNKAVEVREAVGSIMTVYQELGGENGEDRVRNELLLPSRRFIRSEEVFFREAPFQGEIESRRIYLFNDLVIVAQLREPTATSSVRATLTSKRPLSLKKSLGNLFAAVSSSSSLSMEEKSLLSCPQGGQFEVTNWIDLTNAAEIKPLPKPDDLGYYGFRLKSIKRSTITEPVIKATDNTKKVSWGPNVTGSGSAATVKVVTSIKKAEIWMPSRDKLQILIANIEDQIVTLDVLQQNAKLGAEVFGQRQKTRSWIKKKNSGEDLSATGGGGGGSSGGSSGSTSTVPRGRQTTATSVDGSKLDAKEALAQLQKKYSMKNVKAAATPEVATEAAD
ncbi:hypothetical protein BASA81_007139 [Batrachochytrium salamandrivorans]|nr:hypothetical protein BASA81_007139 [Batrachochytrium salamandrivorans]